ncbi:AraC family transcriptional regulator [Corallococcus exercitus]|nr:AraC family transcriptional regulator [Corallococcus exercitus]
MSVFSLCRAFSAVHGEPVRRMQRRLRVRHALAWVLDTAAPLARVAAECGFASQTHLSTQFRRELGLTPGAVRRPEGCKSIFAVPRPVSPAPWDGQSPRPRPRRRAARWRRPWPGQSPPAESRSPSGPGAPDPSRAPGSPSGSFPAR